MGTRNKPAFILLTVFLASCVTSKHVPMGEGKRTEINRIYHSDPGLFHSRFVNGEAVSDGDGNAVDTGYFDSEHYFDSILSDMDFDIDNANITFLYLPFGGQEIGVFYLEPPGRDSKATVFFFHGYFDYAAKFNRFYAALLENGYSVVSVELPGHGLSTGPRGEIGNFEDYGRLVRDALDWADEAGIKKPYLGAGHSTGSAALAIFVTGNTDPGLEAVFLGSPIGRSKAYYPAVVGSVLMRPFMFAVKAGWKGDYSVNYVPLSWFRAQRAWVKTHPEMQPSDIPAFICWGGEDDTLDLKYSRRLYDRLFPNSVSFDFPDGRHNLYVDSDVNEHVFLEAIRFFSLHTKQ